MNKEQSLEEDISHGTIQKPVSIMRFETGPGHLYNEKFFVQRHWHRHIEVLLIREGDFHLELSLENYELHPGDICMINSGELHEMKGERIGTCHDAIIFDPRILEFTYADEVQEKLIEPLLSHTDGLPHIIRKDDEIQPLLWPLLDQTARAGWDPREDWYFYSKFHIYEMLYILASHGRMVPLASLQNAAEKEKIDRYKRIVSYMEAHYAEKVTLEQLSETAKCNPQYLCRFFREIAGVSPIQYLLALRLDKSREMLRGTTKTVLAVSLDCGFENVSYFIRQFRRSTGVTPGEYRKSG